MIAHLKPSSGSFLATFSRRAGEGQRPRATRLKEENSLLLMLGEAVSPEAPQACQVLSLAARRCVLKPRRVGDEGRRRIERFLCLKMKIQLGQSAWQCALTKDFQ
jgi:hypothetical protein